MNVKQLIEKYKRLEGVWDAPGAETARQIFLQDLDQLDEPEKVKVPQFVAGWIEYCKFTHVDLQHALIVGDVYFYNYANQTDFSKLKEFLETENNQATFARAWLDGYEIEKERRYTVVMKGISSLFRHLKYNLLTEKWYMGNDAEDKNVKNTHTRKELEDAGFGEVFNSPLFEVEEVE